MHLGQAPMRTYIHTLIEWVTERRMTLDDIIAHRLPLAGAPHAYEIFRRAA